MYEITVLHSFVIKIPVWPPMCVYMFHKVEVGVGLSRKNKWNIFGAIQILRNQCTPELKKTGHSRGFNFCNFYFFFTFRKCSWHI